MLVSLCKVLLKATNWYTMSKEKKEMISKLNWLKCVDFVHTLQNDLLPHSNWHLTDISLQAYFNEKVSGTKIVWQNNLKENMTSSIAWKYVCLLF